MGRIYRYARGGQDAGGDRRGRGQPGPAFVYNYRLQIDALVSGEVPDSAWAARSVAGKLRKWLKTLDLDEQLRDDLTKFEATVRSRAEDPEAEAEEVNKAVAKTEEAEKAGTPGIYVYTLPHYLKHRIDEETGKTLLKVGHSASDAYYRAGSAGRLTALPETRSCCASTRSRSPRQARRTSMPGSAMPTTSRTHAVEQGPSGS